MKTDTTEIQKQYLDTTPLQSNIINNIDILMDILTDLEFNIFVVLARNRLPMTTRAIRTELVRLEMRKDSKVMNEILSHYIFKEKLKTNRNDLLNKPKVISYAEKEFKKFGAKFPSFEGVDNSLESLKKPGILWKRSVNYRNAKQLWLINPKLFSMWREKRSELLKRKDLKVVDEKILVFYDLED